MRKFILLCSDELKAIFAEIAVNTFLKPTHPEMLKTCGPVIFTRNTKRVNIALTLLFPVNKFNTKLKRTLDSTHKTLFVNAKKPIVVNKGRDRRFTDTYSADFFRFNNCNIQHLAHDLRQGCSRHPSSSTATSNNHSFDFIFSLHQLLSLSV